MRRYFIKLKVINCLRVGLLTLFSCSNVPTASIPSGLIDSAGKPFYLSDSFGRVNSGTFIKDGSEGSIFKTTFPNAKKAQQYAMERRLLILRNYETLIEPYFGTTDAQNCQSNLKSDILEINDQKFLAVLQLLTYGPKRLLHDCLVQNNTHWVNIEFLVCGSIFYDVRIYSLINKPRPEYRPKFGCE